MTTPIENDLMIAQDALCICSFDAYEHALTLRAQTGDKTLKRRHAQRIKNAVLQSVYGRNCDVTRDPTAAEYARYREKLCRDIAEKLRATTALVCNLQAMCAALGEQDAPPATAEKP